MDTAVATAIAAAPIQDFPRTLSLTDRYESLIRLAEVIRSHRDARELFDLLANELRQVLQFDAIAQYDDASNKVHWQLRQPCEVPTNSLANLTKEETVAWWVHRHQQPIFIPYLEQETRFPATVERLGKAGIRSLCALPLSTRHRQMGTLVVGSRLPAAWSADEMRFLSLVSSQIALAMDDALNFQESQRAAERLQLLLDLTNRVISNLDLRSLLREIASGIRQVMQCDGVGVTLPDGETGELTLYALDFPTGRGILREGHVVADTGKTLTEVFQTGRAINLTSEQIQEEKPVAAEGARSLCRLPLNSHGKTLGVLSLGTMREHAFSQDDLVFLGQLSGQIAIAVENAIAYKQIEDFRNKLAEEKIYLEDEIRSELNFEEIIGNSEGLRRVLRQVETVAPTDSTVIIYGETGTGKELIARAVHNLSSRKSGAFVKLNCAAIPTGLLESELFGHEKGAFTGAITQRIGRFELAHRGTVFLDEVGEIPLELQPKLLRVLQEREFERLGGTRTLRSDARLIAATNRDLEQMVDDQTFRSDLFYRLNVFPVRLPALRERAEDIPLLVRHFVQQFSRRNNRIIDTISSETMEALVRYHWPGNIRELMNIIERAVIISKGSTLKVPVSELRPAPVGRNAPQRPASARDNLRETLDETERNRIRAALEESGWIVAGANGAAARLGMKRSTLQFRMRKLGIGSRR